MDVDESTGATCLQFVALKALKNSIVSFTKRSEFLQSQPELIYTLTVTPSFLLYHLSIGGLYVLDVVPIKRSLVQSPPNHDGSTAETNRFNETVTSVSYYMPPL